MIRVLQKLLILSLILLMILGLEVYIASKTVKTILKVDVVSNEGLVYISKQKLVNKLAKLSEQKWFDIDVESIERYLSSIKGVGYTLVKKIWPSTLVIYIRDYKPLAYWNNNQVLLKNMDIITPEVFSYNKDLPHIISVNKDSKDYIYKTYRQLNNIARRYNTRIVKIFYKANQFSVFCQSNIEVILGSTKLQSRLKLFLKSYQKVKNYKSVKYFDMRYSDGFVVDYKQDINN